MTRAVTFVVSVCAFSASAFAHAQPAVVLNPKDLKAYCDEHHVRVYNGIDRIYQTSSYSFTPHACAEDADQLNVKFEVARITDNKIQLLKSDYPEKAFNLLTDTVIDPAVITVTCVGIHLNEDFEPKVTVTSYNGQTTYYQSTAYDTISGCRAVRDSLLNVRNTALAAGKKLQISYTNDPDKDVRVEERN